MYLAGGMAVHLYMTNRVTTDVIAAFAGRVMLPQDNILTDVVLEDGTPRVTYLDSNHNPTFAPMHEDCQDAGNASLKLIRPVEAAHRWAPARTRTLCASVAVHRRRACAYVEGAETIR